MSHLDDADPSNVVRFLLELRVTPSLAVVAAMEPDVHEAMLARASLGLGLPAPGLRGRVDEETALYIAEQVLPLLPPERRRALDGLLHPVLAAAAEACRSASAAARRSGRAALEVRRARAEGGHGPGSLEGVADELLHEAAGLMVAAHTRCEEARGVGRAVRLARRGEAWVPHDLAGAPPWRTEEAAREA